MSNLGFGSAFSTGFTPLATLLNQNPVISEVTVSAYTDTTITITATVDPGNTPLTPALHYGLTTAYGSTKNATEGEISLEGTVTFAVTGLAPYTLYNFKIVAGVTETANATQRTKLIFDADLLVHLDGSITTVGADKYFVDVKNGKNFLITGYDFPTGWVCGFPLKSAATISAPADDATLIAEDINSFLYTAGVANQIPVVSLFQDVDYEHKIFSREVAQTVDANGVELTEAYITDFTIYDTVKSGADLTACQTYYSIPTEEAAYFWVNWVSGSDTPGVGLGTKVAPYKTIERLSNLKSSGTAYIKSSPDAGGTGGNAFIFLDDVLNYKAIGLVKKPMTPVTYALRAGIAGAVMVENFVLVPVNTLSVSPIWGVNGINTTIKKLWINATGANFLQASIRNVLNCVINGTYSGALILLTGVDDGIIKFYNNHINATATYGLLEVSSTNNGKREFYNNRINGVFSNILFGIAANIDYYKFYGNEINLTSATYLINSGSNIGYLEIIQNKFTLKSTYTQDAIYLVAGTAALTKINNNLFNAVSVFTKYIVNTINEYCEVKNNLFNYFSGDSTGVTGAEIALQRSSGNTATFDLIEVSGNKILSNRATNYNIEIGNEGTSTSDNKNTSSIIQKNYIRGANYYAYATGVSVHATFIGFQSNGKVLYNFINGGGYAVIIKGSTGTIGGNVRGNVIIDSDKAIYSKGAQQIIINNNTIIMTERVTQPEFGIALLVNTGGDIPNGCVVKNNIIISLSSNTFNAINVGAEGTNDIDYNIYYCPNGTLQFIVAGVAKTFAQWQALGHDTHSIVLTDAQYNGLLNADYSLKAGSIAIGAGVALDAAYDDGLDASTAWGNDTTLPVIVTKQQAAAWDCGAYVH